MYNTITIYGDINVNYVWAVGKTQDEVTALPKGFDNPTWDADTIALATFEKSESASSYKDENVGIVRYKIYRKDADSSALKYIATLKSDITKIKDYTNFSGNECMYFIYPVRDDGTMSMVLETNKITPIFNYWTIAAMTQTENKNVYTVDVNNVWNFWLSPQVDSFSQVTQKNEKVGFSRYPRIGYSDVNYSSGTLSFLLGDLKKCAGDDYSDDTVAKKNRWLEFANSPVPKILTDPKGECMVVDITPIETSVDYSVCQMPTTIKFKFTQIDSASNISAYGEVKE